MKRLEVDNDNTNDNNLVSSDCSRTEDNKDKMCEAIFDTSTYDY